MSEHRAASRALLLFGWLAAALASAVPAVALGLPSPPGPVDESAARERLRVLRAAAETGRDADIDAFVAFADGHVREHPASPLSRQLRRDLPRSLKAEARRAEAKGHGGRALALYRIYERLPFAPPDRQVTRRRKALEAAFVAARVSPVPRGRTAVARAREEAVIPVDWPGGTGNVSGELHFRNLGEPAWRTVPILPGPDGSLRAVIPAGDVVPPEIRYWTEARDSAGTIRKSGSPDFPLVLRVLRR